MPKIGAFTFVLHSHLPYARQAGRWPHGEEWLHEAAAETYVPLLNALNDLETEGVPARLTLTLTPILLEQPLQARQSLGRIAHTLFAHAKKIKQTTRQQVGRAGAGPGAGIEVPGAGGIE